MSKESLNYRTLREKNLAPNILPEVNRFQLSKDGDYDLFFCSLKKFLGGDLSKEDNRELLLSSALSSGILIDRFYFQLDDYAKTKRSKEYFRKPEKGELLKRYINTYDTDSFDSGTIVEYFWKEKGRFVRLLDEENFFDLAFSRNYPILSKEAQKQIRETTYAIGGLSVGGNIGLMLVMMGAQNFRVADGGNFDVHDVNRTFGAKVADIGENQTIRWCKLALDANPYLKIKAFSSNISLKTDLNLGIVSVDELVNGASIIIESVDDFPAKVGLWEKGIEKGHIKMATDLGLAAKLDIQSKGFPFQGRLTPEILEKLKDPNLGLGEKTMIAIEIIGKEYIPSEYFNSAMQAQYEKKPFWPQPGIAAALSAALVGVSETMRLNGEKNIRDQVIVDLHKALQA